MIATSSTTGSVRGRCIARPRGGRIGHLRQLHSRPHDLLLRRQHQGDCDRSIHEERQAHPRGDAKDQLGAPRLAQGRSHGDGSGAHRPGLGDPCRARIQGAHPRHLRLPLARHQRHAAADGRRPGQREPAHPRQGHGRAVPGRAGEDAALLGPDPRARRRRLLSDVGHTVCAHRHRPRARVAAPAASRAGAALPQGPHRAPAERRRSDHAGGRPPGASRSHGARRRRSPSSTSCAHSRRRR